MRSLLEIAVGAELYGASEQLVADAERAIGRPAGAGSLLERCAALFPAGWSLNLFFGPQQVDRATAVDGSAHLSRGDRVVRAEGKDEAGIRLALACRARVSEATPMRPSKTALESRPIEGRPSSPRSRTNGR